VLEDLTLFMELIKPLLTLSYWFGSGIQPFQPVIGRGLLVLMSALVVASGAVAAYLYLQKQLTKNLRHILTRVVALLGTMGFVGLLMSWFNYEGIPVFSMRFWYIVWLGTLGYWVFSIARECRQQKTVAAAVAERAKYEKWLPKPKH